MLTTYQAEWLHLYQAEEKRILDALGKLTERGIVEGIAHIGATSVLGMAAHLCIDIALSVWPFPLTDGARHQLTSIGYLLPPEEKEADAGEDTEQNRASDGLCLRHESGRFQLYIYDAGNHRYYDHLLVRNYLREDEAARQAYSQHRQVWVESGGESFYNNKKAAFLTKLVEQAHEWWITEKGFEPLHVVTGELSELECPWTISSGWAIDLCIGEVTRYHHDVDVVIDRRDQLILQAYLTERGWTMLSPYKGQLELWPAQMAIALPRHQIHAHRDDEFIDILLTDFPGGVWQFRREPTILRSLEKVRLSTESGLHYLSPEVVLLFKGKNTGNKARPQDISDFEHALPKLCAEQRAWLRWALIVTAPEHPWIDRLI